MATSIERAAFAGCNEAWLLRNDRVEARVVADVGPRVLELRARGGANLFYLRDAELGGRGEPEWRMRGGWRLWIAPERRATTYALDNAPCTVVREGPATLVVTGPPQPSAIDSWMGVSNARWDGDSWSALGST